MGRHFSQNPIQIGQIDGSRHLLPGNCREYAMQGGAQAHRPLVNGRRLGRLIGGGIPGPTAKALRRAYHGQAEFS